MIPIQVVGIGLDGADGLSPAVRQQVEQATLLVGSARHLGYFPHYGGERLLLTDLGETIVQLRQWLQHHDECSAMGSPALSPGLQPTVVILASGDPLFFGLGRLLLTEFLPERLTFHPHLSAVQLAFSRVRVPWQDAHLISAHGRSLEELTTALQQGVKKLAVLTDAQNTPAAIARLLQSLELPCAYRIWVCENLGGAEERILETTEPGQLLNQVFAPLNVVVLLQESTAKPLEKSALPLLGLPDSSFLSFPDRPGLITKREVRVLVLAELGLQNGQVVWDVGAGTGSVSIEIARLCPSSRIYGVEKTAIGMQLIQQNCQRFGVGNVFPIAGVAPAALAALPSPDRVFIGGSGGQLPPILEACQERLQPDGIVVLALATLEHLQTALAWFNHAPDAWQYRLLQVQLARSIAVAALTRFAPLNPLTLLVANRKV